MKHCLKAANEEEQKEFLNHALPILDKEYLFWTTRRRVNGDKYAPLNTYSAETNEPSPRELS